MQEIVDSIRLSPIASVVTDPNADDNPIIAANHAFEQLTGYCEDELIGRNCRIEKVILDKNVHVGDNVVITPEGKPENMDSELFYIRDGIVVIPKDTVIPAGTWI